MLRSRSDAYELLRKLGAPDRLMQLAEMVSQAADGILLEFAALSVPCDRETIELGAVLHDTGKIQHPQELSAPGTLHEQAGEKILLADDVQPAIAKCCASHGTWDAQGVSFEEKIVALADKLWKGKRESALELDIIDEVAQKLNLDRWDIFERLDASFEDIASDGAQRIERTR